MPVSAPFRGLLLGALLAVLAAAPAVAGPVIVYATSDPAHAIHDGAAGLPGLRDAYRQAPAAEDPRYPTARRVGKIGGRELAAMDAVAMAARVRAELRQRDVGDLVAVDEVEASRYTPERLAELARALDILGPDGQKLVFYVSPGTVSQVGRVDRRAALPARYARLVEVLARGGHTYLVLYHGDGSPFAREVMARDLAGWQARWPADRATRLHVMTGPEAGAGQAEIWDRVRATPAGRALLGNGPSVWGLRSAGEGLRWLAQYRAYLAAPTAIPAGGEARVPTGGGLAITLPGPRLRPGATVRVRVGRPGRATVQLVPRGGTPRRIRAITGPANAAVRLPVDVRPGRYTLRVVLLGDGLRDVATASFTMVRR